MIIHAWFADNYPFPCDVIVGHFKAQKHTKMLEK
jgi:hypothetical protein